MIAVDTNLLVYAHRRDSEWHEPARRALAELAESPAPWAIPWPCVYEFYAIATHPQVYDPPSTPDQALDQLDAWLEAPSLVLLGESRGFWPKLRELLSAARLSGPRVHDARIAALCVDGGVRELLSADRDFSRFPDLETRNPLIG
ncbi:MAG: type II toxin-antitoxin system VapC family toxin [Thermoanaerobaculia bacterium]